MSTRKGTTMSLPILGELVATLAARATTWKHEQARLRRNIRAINHLEGMPAYLRNDIGLPAGSDITRTVETGRTSGASGGAARETLGITPHAT